MKLQTVSPRESPFVALCSLASRERWCCNLMCTTCGHMLFRYALRQLAFGRSPDDENWLVHQDHPVLRRGSPLQELGSIPPRSAWPAEEQKRLAMTLSTANISLIASTCASPDWLGYLGLGLHYTEDFEQETRTLTVAWCPQLQRLVHPNSTAFDRLCNLTLRQEGTLSWRDLELVEAGIQV